MIRRQKNARYYFHFLQRIPKHNFQCYFWSNCRITYNVYPDPGSCSRPIFQPLLLIIGMGIGIVEDFNDKHLARKMKEVNAEFLLLKA